MENCDICDMCGFVAQTKKIFSKHKKTHDTKQKSEMCVTKLIQQRNILTFI